ncbi:synaptic vesicle glycoprotein 2C [Diachasma alloeum]|uniref:synaptic vesicle glycoprotein 2C n=1 Tax=Diachasma alloeum TaxID=454923 RepID=UPI0007382B6F|nr:synaptic vesicle glycoprotein 2C [Diachasma alloeum]XP_015108436.1 synaptic vesicle glycoprotein 2C [Diachasma alloeum]XP_015108439.1 synaptic vesicle glycoprotein 2C [Diachasma alloeum]XP_015108440.1 synaptic vesicle glycoprotein 2C [Diachasma alloeum]XP_015108441.1 synaptic vesicle glycoprotein 2C [Diachasma alloeum]XP_028982697.1 synaptic vesicle glycoprotein 2C [Diachasma alloeum]
MGLDFLADGGADFEHAITVTGFGKFHYMLLMICGLIYMDTAIGVTIISFVLPAAQCDLQMDSTTKGWLSASPMFGMVIGSYIWGCLADTKGRKIVLIATLLMDGIVGIVSSFVQQFWPFLLLRFFNGFAVTGAMGICFPYLGEFQPTKYREKILCWMEMFWTVGVIVLPLIAWLIVPLNITYESESFYFKSWNLFVALCALPSLMLALWLFAFPESPKFLLECGETEKALEVFRWIYAQNTRSDPSEYPVKSLQEKTNPKDKSTRTLRLHKHKDLKVLCSEVWDLTKALCKPPYLRNTVLACGIQFGLTSSYYTLMVWFPELFTRFEEFEVEHPGESTSVCIVSLPTNSTQANPYGCGNIIATDVYLHTVYIGLACIPGSIILPLFIHKVGAKVFLIASLVISGAVTIGFYFVTSSDQNLILSCIFEALTSLGISLVYCVIVDMFPTNLRVMAAALSLTMGRLGALVGNLVFGYLIDLACVVPIILFAAFLFICGSLSFFLPRTGKDTLD